jgi:hypothetical protein
VAGNRGPIEQRLPDPDPLASVREHLRSSVLRRAAAPSSPMSASAQPATRHAATCRVSRRGSLSRRAEPTLHRAAVVSHGGLSPLAERACSGSGSFLEVGPRLPGDLSAAAGTIRASVRGVARGTLRWAAQIMRDLKRGPPTKPEFRTCQRDDEDQDHENQEDPYDLHWPPPNRGPCRVWDPDAPRRCDRWSGRAQKEHNQGRWRNCRGTNRA